MHINEGPKGCFSDQESMDGGVTPKLTAVIENSEGVERFVSFSKPSTLVQGGINTGKMNVLCCLCMLTDPSLKSVETMLNLAVVREHHSL